MAERNPLVLTDLGGGAGKLEELPASDTLPAAATAATLIDAAASSDLPPVGAPSTLAALVQAARNTLKWLISRFNSSGFLSLASGGTGAGDAPTARINIGLGNVDNTPDAAKVVAAAAHWATPRSINGTAVDGSADVKISEWLHSERDFNAGVLVRTDLPYVDEGVPWVLEVRGNSYGQIIPLHLDVQGYMYNGTCINTGAVSSGAPFPDIYVVRLGDGTIGFWWGRVEYWQGFSVRVYVAYPVRPVNRAIHVSDIAKPVSVPAAKEVRVTPVQAAFQGSDAKFAVLESTVGVRQGPLAPLTATKVLTGVLPSARGETVIGPLGLNASKVLSVKAVASVGVLSIPDGFLQAASAADPEQYLFSVYWRADSNDLRAQVGDHSSGVYGASVSCLVEYIVN